MRIVLRGRTHTELSPSETYRALGGAEVRRRGHRVAMTTSELTYVLSSGLRCEAMTTGTAMRHTRIGYPALF
jgi:hypothetical protein